MPQERLCLWAGTVNSFQCRSGLPPSHGGCLLLHRVLRRIVNADSTVDSSSEVSTRPNSHMDEAKTQKVTLHSHNYPFLYKPKPSWRCKKASLASNHLTFVVGGLTVSSTPQEEENLNVLIRVRPALGDEQKQDKGGSLPRTLVAKYVLRPSSSRPSPLTNHKRWIYSGGTASRKPRARTRRGAISRL